MHKTISFVNLLTCVVSLSIGIAIGHSWQSPMKLASALKTRALSHFRDEVEERAPNLLHNYKLFDEGAALKLHVFQPDISNGANEAGIILFHGGGWTYGTADLFYPHCTQLAAKGIACISAEYRTSSSHDTSPLHAVEDAKDAYHYVVNNLQQLGLAANQWYVAGASAGGHLAASIVSADYPEFKLERAYPQGIILLGTVIDNSKNGYGFERVKFFGDRFSPLHNLDEKFPRTLFILGGNDRFVPTNTARKFVSTLDALDVEATLRIYPEAYHSFYMSEYFDETMEDIEQFLLRESGSAFPVEHKKD